MIEDNIDWEPLSSSAMNLKTRFPRFRSIGMLKCLSQVFVFSIFFRLLQSKGVQAHAQTEDKARHAMIRGMSLCHSLHSTFVRNSRSATNRLGLSSNESRHSSLRRVLQLQNRRRSRPVRPRLPLGMHFLSPRTPTFFRRCVSAAERHEVTLHRSPFA